jgi:hypothetical protein
LNPRPLNYKTAVSLNTDCIQMGSVTHLIPCHSSGSYLPASHRGGRAPIPGQDKMTLEQLFSEYFSFHEMLHSQVSSGADTTGQLVANIPSGLSLISPHTQKKKILRLLMVLFPGKSARDREADHSFPCSVENKNAWSRISILPHVLIMWCLIKRMDNLYPTRMVVLV